MAVCLKSKCQTLLNLDLPQIIKTIKLNDGGRLMHKTTKEAKFGYDIPPEGNICIFFTTCYFTSEHKCFKYINIYWGDELANKEVDRLREYYPDLKKIDGNSQWKDNKHGFEVTLTNVKHNNDQRSYVYSLEIHNMNNRSKS